MLKTYVLNLDKHDRRMQKMHDQLFETDLDWVRYPGIDASEVGDAFLDSFVARHGPIPRMPIGARACTAGHFQILKDFVTSKASHALILEDDAVISEKLAEDLPNLVSAAGDGIINISRQIPTGSEKKLIVRSNGLKVGSYYIPELAGIHYSGAGYTVDRNAAETLLEMFPYPNMPVDHILFNPNVSDIGKRVPVRQLFPALVRPRESLVSSIQTVPVDGSKKLRNRLKRAKAELSIAPRLLLGVVTGRYEILRLDFE